MRKKFRILDNELSTEGRKAFHPLYYRIEQQHCILFGLISLWSSPDFAPPHYFTRYSEAEMAILQHYPTAVIIDETTVDIYG